MGEIVGIVDHLVKWNEPDPKEQASRVFSLMFRIYIYVYIDSGMDVCLYMYNMKAMEVGEGLKGWDFKWGEEKQYWLSLSSVGPKFQYMYDMKKIRNCLEKDGPVKREEPGKDSDYWVHTGFNASRICGKCNNGDHCFIYRSLKQPKSIYEL